MFRCPVRRSEKRNAIRGEMAFPLRVGLWTKEKGINHFCLLAKSARIMQQDRGH
jgi:hypothetical protein